MSAHNVTQKRRKCAYVFKSHTISVFLHVNSSCCHFCPLCWLCNFFWNTFQQEKRKISSTLATHGDSVEEECSEECSRMFPWGIGNATPEDLKFLMQAISRLYWTTKNKVLTEEVQVDLRPHEINSRYKSRDTNHVIHINSTLPFALNSTLPFALWWIVPASLPIQEWVY